jgi:heavy metal sensor kinase
VELRDASGALMCRSPGLDWDALGQALPAATDGGLAPASLVMRGEALRAGRARVVARGRMHNVVVALPTTQTAAALARFRAVLSWLLPALIVAVAAGGYWIVGRALDPVARMTLAVRAIDAHRLDQRLEVPADDELRSLALTFNDLLQRLDAAFAEAARFTAEAAHELRTPVALVRTTAELALRRERTAGDYKQSLGQVLEEAERMSGLVRDLLALARADAGAEPHADALCDLGQIARSAARDLWAAHPGRAATLRLEDGAGPVSVRGDAASLRRLAHALLDNAAKYTPAEGSVRVRVVREGPEALLEIQDSGVGIAADELPRVFERFQRGVRGREMAASGTGLGLAIAREIALRHGGAITIESPDAKGCTVRVRLPAVPALDAAERPQPALGV